MSELYARDCRGRVITIGSTVVVAGSDRSLYERIVKRIDGPQTSPSRWTEIWFEGGGWTTPERCAVVR